jgi:gliding motility-associated-like protein
MTLIQVTKFLGQKVYQMKKIMLLVAFLFFYEAQSQLRVNVATSANIHSFIQKLVGEGVTISNVRYSDSLCAMGYFTDSLAQSGFKKGIILTTGSAKLAEGPNDATTANKINNLPGDLDLQNLYAFTGNITSTSDASFIEFDFTANIDTIRIRYAFASEEYNAQNFELYDLMGIFLSVSGIAGYRNIATIPGTNIYISADNINGGNEPDYCKIPPIGNGENINYYIFNPCTSNKMRYNGFTTVLETNVKIQPCQNYKMKIAIADFTTDKVYDSAVMLEEFSFGKPLITINQQDAGDLIAQCESKKKPVLSATVNNGIYNWYFNNSLLGANTKTITTTGMGMYRVNTTVSSGCVWQDSVRLSIGNDFQINAFAADSFVCNIKTQALGVNTSLPDSIYTYFWTGESDLSNQTIASPLVTPKKTSTFKVQVENQKGCIVRDSVKISVNEVKYTTNATTLSPIICKNNKAILVSGYSDNKCLLYSISTVNPDFGLINSLQTISLGYEERALDISLGFQFEFYCKKYDSINIYSNGFVAFGNPIAASYSGTIIPNPQIPNNLIAVGMTNLTGSTVKYGTIGNAPNRIFIVEFKDVADAYINLDTVSVRLKMFESSNEIEIHTEKIKSSFNYILQGIENATGDAGITIPNRNFQIFNASNDAWKFTPNKELSTRKWTDLAGTTLAQDQDTIMVKLPLSQTFLFKINSSKGCEFLDTASVQVVEKTFLTTKDTAICIKNPISLNASGADRYLWKNQNSTLSSINLSPQSSSTYSVTGFFNNPFNCEVNKTINVQVNPLPLLSKTQDTTVCQNEYVKLKVNNGKVKWNDETLGNEKVIQAVQNQVYKFSVENEWACSIKDSIIVNVKSLPIIDLKGDSIICEGERAFISHSGIYNWTWSVPTTKMSDTIVSIIISENTFVRGTAVNVQACSTVDSVYIRVRKIPLENFISATGNSICELNQTVVTLTSPIGYSASWENGFSNLPSLIVSDEKVYSLTITDIYKCSKTDTILIKRDCRGIYIIPNVFSPNNDGINENFEIRGLEPNSRLAIYNRWGKLVFESNNYDNLWNGATETDGLYYYNFEPSSISKKFNGWVQVVR